MTLHREMLSRIRSRFCDAGQGHVFTWWDDLTTEGHNHLYRQLTSIDLDLLKRLIEEHLTRKNAVEERMVEPPPIIRIPKTPEEYALREKAKKVGESLIREGRCAAFVVAGSGEADLDLHRIKGKYPITPVTGKSLFQLHTEKIIALRRWYGMDLPFFVMTSADNHEETKRFFEESDNFGLPGDDLFFFSQGMLPAIDLSGKLIMEDKSSLYMSPDGHGGSIRSLYNSGALEVMEERGIDTIYYFQVDNPLAIILDPVFLGHHRLASAEISSKVVRKRGPEEKVGTLGMVNGGLGVVEYSDLPKEAMYARDGAGELKFFAGNIAIHILNVSFVRKLSEGAFKLRFHKSERAIECIDDKGAAIKPTANNAICFESFVFDALHLAATTVSLEVAREEEFAPFKNVEGEDSPEVCMRMMSTCYKSWLKKAGYQVADPDEVRVEVSPLFALDGERFAAKVKGGEIFSKKLFIE